MEATRPDEPRASRDVEKVELAVARLLRLGTTAAAALIVAGLLLLLLTHSTGIGPLLVTAGLIALVCTPLLRVAAAMVIYLKLGDLTYSLICLSVLVFVFAGFLLGRTH